MLNQISSKLASEINTLFLHLPAYTIEKNGTILEYFSISNELISNEVQIAHKNGLPKKWQSKFFFFVTTKLMINIFYNNLANRPTS